MTGIAELWIPILLSAVIVFVASSIIHMVLPWHKGDYRKTPDEEKVRAALGPLDIPPGDYMIPCPSTREQMRSPEHMEKVKQGPVIVMTVLPPGGFSIGRNLVSWFIYLIVVGVFSAYIAGRALPDGAHYLTVFRFAGATAFIAYSLALWQMSIWYRRSLSTTIKSTIDGLIYGMLTAGTFGWLWPR